MRENFAQEGIEPAAPKRDTELTLGPFMLLVLFFCLALLCGLFFGLGYAVGHHGATASQSTLMQTSTDSSALSSTDSSQIKPSANTRMAQTSQQVSTETQATTSDDNQSVLAGESSQTTSSSATAFGASAGQPLSAQSTTRSTGGINTSAPATGPLMVQIAAVSHQEDANVLVAALRKRGYAVTASRDPGDGLLHVRIGPFSSRSEAYSMRDKLLKDGYNAIVQQ
jgi:DedD protein